MGGIKATKVSSLAVSSVYEQEAADGDWTSHEIVTDYMLPEIIFDATTTATQLDTSSILVQNDLVRLYNSTDGLKLGSLGAVTTNSISLISSSDPLGGGNLMSKFEFEDVADGQTFTTIADTLGLDDATATNIVSTAGEFGQGGLFNGSNSVATFTGTAGVITISFFASKASDGSYKVVLGNTGDNSALMFRETSDSLRISINDGAGIDLTTLQNIPLNTINHFVVMWTSSTSIELYMNGVLQSTTTVASYQTSYPYNKIGNRLDDALPMDGILDQIELYNRVLTLSEINLLYTQSITNYSTDITSIGLTVAPTLAYKETAVTSSVCLEPLVSDLANDNYDAVSVVSDTFDGVGTFTKTNSEISKQGRALKYKIVADTDASITQININLKKLGA